MIIRFWKRLKYWQKGIIIGLIFVMLIYTPITLIFKDACKTVPCGEVCTPERPYINPERCHFWTPIFLVLLIISLLPLLSGKSNFLISSLIFILYFFILGYIIDRIKGTLKKEDNLSKSIKMGAIVYLISVIVIFVFAKIHNDMIGTKESLTLSYFFLLLLGSLILGIVFFVIAIIISFIVYCIKEKRTK